MADSSYRALSFQNSTCLSFFIYSEKGNGAVTVSLLIPWMARGSEFDQKDPQRLAHLIADSELAQTHYHA
jgi:hypothetical protein